MMKKKVGEMENRTSMYQGSGVLRPALAQLDKSSLSCVEPTSNGSSSWTTLGLNMPDRNDGESIPKSLSGISKSEKTLPGDKTSGEVPSDLVLWWALCTA